MINMDLSYLYGAVSELSYERNAYGELVCSLRVVDALYL